MMYDYVALENELGRRTYFPNVSDEAWFAPQSQTIHLNRITERSFREALKNKDFIALRRQSATMLHEITHWADLVGTLWGRNYIRNVYQNLRLIERVDSSGSEIDFYNFVDLHDQTRRMMLGKYYRTLNSKAPKHDHKRPWRFSLSAGREFDPSGRLNNERPVVFARFSDRASDELIARQPVVVGSLLEVNAVWSELRTNYEALHSMQKIDQAIEEKEFIQDRIRQLYHPELTLYTAPAHLLSKVARTIDVSVAYHLASLIAHVVLNLSDDDFNRLQLPSSMKLWEELFAGFVNSRDRGFAFAVISHSATQWVEGRSALQWLDEALGIAGLRPASEIYARALDQMRSDVVEGNDLLARAERYLLTIGVQVLSMRSEGDTALTLSRAYKERLPIPPMFDADGNLIDLSNGLFDQQQFAPERLHEQEARLFTWTNNFLNACR